MKKNIFMLTVIAALLFSPGRFNPQTAIQDEPLLQPSYTVAVDSFLNLIGSTSGIEKLRLYQLLHKALYEVGDIEVHLKFDREFAEAAKAQKNKRGEAAAYVLAIEAMWNYRMSDSLIMDEALKALSFMRDVPGAEIHYYYTASTVSNIYILRGNYEEALEYAEKYYEEAKRKKNTSGVVTTLQTMGKAFEGLGMLDSAEAAYREVIATANDENERFLKGESYSSLVEMLNGQNLHDEALRANEEFEEYLERIDACNGELRNLCFLNDLGYVASYAKSGQFGLARAYLSKAEDYPVAAIGTGAYLLENGRLNLLLEEGGYDLAEQSLKRLDEILSGDPSRHKADLKLIKARADLYYRWGKYDRSTEAYINYIAESDSLQKREMTARLNMLRTQYRVDKIQMQKERQRFMFRVTVLWLSVVLALFCVIVAVMIVNDRKLRAKNRSLIKRIGEHDQLERKYEQMRSEKALNDIGASSENDGRNLYFRLRELMQDPAVFINPGVNRKTIAERLRTNEKYVFDTVKEYYGTNISDYINKLRLNYARSLLGLPADNRTIEAVAIDSGFNSRSTFYRLFKEYYGMTPVEFRRLVSVSTGDVEIS